MIGCNLLRSYASWTHENRMGRYSMTCSSRGPDPIGIEASVLWDQVDESNRNIQRLEVRNQLIRGLSALASRTIGS